MRRELRLLPALVLAAVSCATVPSVGDRAFRAGDYAAATAAYEEALRTDAGARDDAALRLRLALAYARPGPAHDVRKAAAVLQRLGERFPRSRAAGQAALLLPQLEREAALENAAATATAQIAALQATLAASQQEMRTLETAARAANEQLQRLRAALAEREAQLKRVRDELEQLKRIDLQRGP